MPQNLKIFFLNDITFRHGSTGHSGDRKSSLGYMPRSTSLWGTEKNLVSKTKTKISKNSQRRNTLYGEGEKEPSKAPSQQPAQLTTATEQGRVPLREPAAARV